MIWTFTLPCVTPSGNEVLDWQAHSPHKLANQKKKWFLIVSHFAHMVKLRRLEEGEKQKRRVLVTRFGSRLLDVGNLALGMDKLILDNLVHGCWLYDDRPEFCDFIPKQEKCKRSDERTVVELSEL